MSPWMICKRQVVNSRCRASGRVRRKKKINKTYRCKKKKTANPFFPFPFPPKSLITSRTGQLTQLDPEFTNSPIFERPRYKPWQGCCNTNKNRGDARVRECINAEERERNWRCLATDPRHGVIHFGEVSLYAISLPPIAYSPSRAMHSRQLFSPGRCTQTIDAPNYWPTNVRNRGDLILNQSTAVSRLIYNQPWFESFVARRRVLRLHAAALNENILIDCRITIAGLSFLSLKIRSRGIGL